MTPREREGTSKGLTHEPASEEYEVEERSVPQMTNDIGFILFVQVRARAGLKAPYLMGYGATGGFLCAEGRPATLVVKKRSTPAQRRLE